VVPEWRLVPNDNNVGQRNVTVVAGGGGMEGLIASLHGVSFFVGNPNPKRGLMELQVHLPRVLTAAGWKLEFDGVTNNRFDLASGAKREVFIRLQPGRDFDRNDVVNAADRDIRIDLLADDNVIGGMTYRLDPDISRPYNTTRPDKRGCTDRAQALIDCLGCTGRKVKKVKIKEIVLSVSMDDDDC
jgi:hypothetical protein